MFEHFLRLKGHNEAGAAGPIESVSPRHSEIEEVEALVFDCDMKSLKPEFRGTYHRYLTTLIPELELRTTSRDGNVHAILKLKPPVSPAEAKRIHAVVAKMVFADPCASPFMAARVAGSNKQKPDQAPHTVTTIQTGRPVVGAALLKDLESADELKGSFGWQRRIFGALVPLLIGPDGKPLNLHGHGHGVCPIHGSGANPKQCMYNADRACCFCYSDCKPEGGTAKRISLNDILRARVLEDAVANDMLGNEQSRPTVFNGPMKPRSDFFSELAEALAATGELFNREGQVYTDHGGELRAVTDGDDMAHLASVLVQIAAGKRPHCSLLRSDGKALLKDTAIVRHLPEISTIARVPVMNDEGRWSTPGYNPSDGVYYVGETIVAAKGTAHIDRLLELIPFANDAYRTNAMALMLDRLLTHRFAGERPMAVIKGNQPGIGKTALATMVAKIGGGRSDSVTYKHNDEEFEKAIGASVENSSCILIDNARSRKTIGSPCLEKTLTDEDYSFRRLGTSTKIRGHNDLLFLITLNGGTFSTDLIDRSMFVRLNVDGDPRPEWPRKIGAAAEMVSKHRKEIVAELMGMLDNWHASGRPKAKTTHRFGEWADTIGGILEANDVRGLLATHTADSGDFNEGDPLLEGLAAAAPGEEHPAAWWADRARSEQLLPPDKISAIDKALVTWMGKSLSDAAGRLVHVPSEDGCKSYVLTRKKARKGKVYVFTPTPTPDATVPHPPNVDPEVRRGGSAGLKATTTDSCGTPAEPAEPTSLSQNIESLSPHTADREVGGADGPQVRQVRHLAGNSLAESELDDAEPFADSEPPVRQVQHNANRSPDEPPPGDRNGMPRFSTLRQHADSASQRRGSRI